MASPKVATAIKDIEGEGKPLAAYRSLLERIKTLSTPQTITEDLKAIVNSFYSPALGIIAGRELLSSVKDALRDLENDDLTIEVGQYTLRLITPQLSSYIYQAVTIRELVASAYESNEDFQAAATTLADIPLESSQRRVTPEDKAKIWIRIVRNYLEVDDTTSAEAYLNRLKNLMHEVKSRELNLHFKLSQARIQDAKRDFLAASQGYHEISFSPVIAEEERLHTLSMAIKCAILAPAGPRRSRALGRLYKDERSAGLEEHGMLEKMFFDRILTSDEVEKFSRGLQPHQLAKTSDGSTVLAKAVVEHNLLGVSRLYSNVGFDALAVMLDLDADKAEETTSRMIEQGRLVGRIDQIDRIVWFEKGDASGEKGSGRAEVVVGKEIRRWDANVHHLAEEVENITNALQQQFPDFVAKHLVV